MTPIQRPTDRVRALARRWALAVEPARNLRFQLVSARLQHLVGERAIVLDAGCGDGLLAEAIAHAHPDWSVIGVDTNEEMLRRGRERIAREGIGNVELRKHDLTEPLGTEVYDVVLAVESLEEIADDEAALRSLAASLRQGGLFIAHVPERDWKPVLAGSARTWKHEVRHGYSADELVAKLSRVGLHMRAITPTSRGTVRFAQELIDRAKPRDSRVRAALYPLTSFAVWLERRGLTCGPPRALLAEAVKGDIGSR